MANSTTTFDCHILHFRKIQNLAGNITPIENNLDIPFDIKRIFYLYDIPGGEARGGHGHRELHQILISASGSFDVTIDDGKNKKTVNLNRPYMGLHIKPGIWGQLTNFSSGSICLVLASHIYDENDYFRDYNAFLNFRNGNHP